MKAWNRWTGTVWAVLLLGCWLSTAVAAADEPFELEIEGSTARVNLLEGEARVWPAGEAEWRNLAEGDPLAHGDMVRTSAGARVELLLSDGSVLRFDEETAFEIKSLDVSEESGKREVEFKMLAGKTWAKVRAFTGEANRFEIFTQNAVAGIRGTTYRVDESPEEGALVRVYAGEVQVRNVPVTAPPASAGMPGEVSPAGTPGPADVGPPGEVAGPSMVSGPAGVSAPSEVAGPREVTLMEWVYLVRAWQQIRIDPKGRVSPPTSFTREEDVTDWVLWNERRDGLVQP